MARPPLRDYQMQGIAFLSPRRAALLADEPGSGKSVQALEAAKAVGATRLMILCPAIGALSWPQQIALWQDPTAPTVRWDKNAHKTPLPPGPLNLLVSYDQLVHHRERLLLALRHAEPFQCAILDECHYLKNRAATRTKSVYGGKIDTSKSSSVLHYLTDDAPVWILSGTPWPNNFSEFWTHANALFPEFVKTLFHTDRVSFGQWLMALCDVHQGNYGARVTGTKKTARPAIRAALGPIMLRRTKKEILPDLKAPQFYDAPIEQKIPEGWDEDMEQELRHAGWDGTDQTLAQALRYLSATNPHVSSRRLMLGDTKAAPSAEYINEWLANAPKDHKALVFAYHTSVLDTLSLALAKHNPAKITGRTSLPGRVDEEKRFQNDPDCRVFIGQIVAAGTSITLTAGSAVFIVEPDWVPAVNDQAIARAHRQGQKRDVIVYWLSAPGSLDNRIMSVLKQKTQDLSETLGDNTDD